MGPVGSQVLSGECLRLRESGRGRTGRKGPGGNNRLLPVGVSLVSETDGETDPPWCRDPRDPHPRPRKTGTFGPVPSRPRKGREQVYQTPSNKPGHSDSPDPPPIPRLSGFIPPELLNRVTGVTQGIRAFENSETPPRPLSPDNYLIFFDTRKEGDWTSKQLLISRRVNY